MRCCLNDQATIAWFTSTRGVYQVGFLAYKLYSGLMRVHFIDYLWLNISAVYKIFFVLKYFRNYFYYTQMKNSLWKIVRPTLKLQRNTLFTSQFVFGISGEVGRSWRYCNARSTRDRAGASSWTLSPAKNQFNIEEDTWSSYQILSW